MTKETAAAPRRPYDNTLRRERAAQTRDRIIAAGAELLQDASIRDWRGVTIRGVAERAGVNERTVFRHFGDERALRDAVMHRLEEQSGIDLEHLRIDQIKVATAKMLEQVASFPLREPAALDPTLADASRRLHEAFLRAVDGAVEGAADDGWSEADRTLTAAMFDTLWALSSYERLVADWQLEHGEAVRGITWVMSLLERAITEGPPPRPRPASAR
ncbi:MAG: TetR/AcrR family transcriptional regulator [Acidimicrobiales bacterium]